MGLRAGRSRIGFGARSARRRIGAGQGKRGASPYLQSATDDASGRPELLTLGNNALKLDYVYHPWTAQDGRPAQLKAGTPSNLTSLQDLRYSYDAVGNVLKLNDYKAGSPQAQSFGYDALDRLITATVSGGTGGLYPAQSYAYDPTGNLTSKTGVGGYSYNAAAPGGGACQAGTRPTKPHALDTAGSPAVVDFNYDCNGNVTTRVTPAPTAGAV